MISAKYNLSTGWLYRFIFVSSLLMLQNYISDRTSIFIILITSFLPIFYMRFNYLIPKLIKNIFLYYGAISFPLYLIHENALISLIQSIHYSKLTTSFIIEIIIPLSIVVLFSHSILKIEKFITSHMDFIKHK